MLFAGGVATRRATVVVPVAAGALGAGAATFGAAGTGRTPVGDALGAAAEGAAAGGGAGVATMPPIGGRLGGEPTAGGDGALDGGAGTAAWRGAAFAACLDDGLTKSSTYGSATAAITPSTSMTRRARNQSAEKMLRCRSSSYASFS
jgi:hypothetical protein